MSTTYYRVPTAAAAPLTGRRVPPALIAVVVQQLPERRHPVNLKEEHAMSDIDSIVRRYIETWNETDPARRRAAIEELYTENGGYTDPLVAASGWDAIDQTIAGAQQQFTGLVFGLAGTIDAHHDTARFTWHLGAPDAAEPLVVGFDVAVTENGRLRQVYGFLDKVPSA